MNETRLPPSVSARQQKYRDLIFARRFAELQRALKIQGEPIQHHLVHSGFQAYLKEEHPPRMKLFYIMKLAELTAVQPDESVLAEVCEMSLNGDSLQVFKVVAERLHIPREFFPRIERVLQSVFQQQINTGQFVDLAQLAELTALTPKPEFIQQGYRNYLGEGRFISFAGLIKRSGVTPDPTLLQEFYRRYREQQQQAVRNNDESGAGKWAEYIEKLQRISGVAPAETT